MAAYKDKRGKWYISVYYDTWEGKRSRKVKRGFSTKREALAWERSFLTQTSGNLDMTFEEFVELYKRDLKERLKLNTWVMKTSVIDGKILPYFKDKKVKDITAADIIAWQNVMLSWRDENGKPYSPGYLKTIHNQELICKGWFLPPNTYDCGSFVVNGTAVIEKELNRLNNS